MTILRMRSVTSRPASATAYAAGDEVSNSASAGSVVRATFNLAGFQRGRILSAAIDLSAASGDVVTTAANFELMLFRTADSPTAVGDNATMPITAARRALAVGVFVFDDTGWTGPLGTQALGTSQFQAVGAHLVLPQATPVLQSAWPAGFYFDFNGYNTKTLTAVIRTLAAWTPGAVSNTFGISLDLDLD